MLRVSGRHNGKELYFSHGSNHSRGVAILVRDELDFNLNSASSDDDGGITVLHCCKRGFQKLPQPISVYIQPTAVTVYLQVLVTS